MNEKLLQIYDECMKHNISIGIKYLLSDAVIEVTGVTLGYNLLKGRYEHFRCEKWVSIQEMKNVNDIDLVVFTIEEIFHEMNDRKDRLLSGGVK